MWLGVAGTPKHSSHAARMGSSQVMNQGDSTHLFVVASGLVEGSCRQLLSKVDKALGLFKAGQVMGEVTMIGSFHTLS